MVSVNYAKSFLENETKSFINIKIKLTFMRPVAVGLHLYVCLFSAATTSPAVSPNVCWVP